MEASGQGKAMFRKWRVRKKRDELKCLYERTNNVGEKFADRKARNYYYDNLN